MEMENEQRVKMSEYRITQAPCKLVTVGLGSCVGTLIYEPTKKIGGLSHIMLPDSTLFTHATNLKCEKFADLALPQMFAELKKRAPLGQFHAKIVGGAEMFARVTEQPAIGSRNIQAVETILNELHIPLIAKEVGGEVGRTMIVDLETGITTVKIVDQPLRYI